MIISYLNEQNLKFYTNNYDKILDMIHGHNYMSPYLISEWTFISIDKKTRIDGSDWNGEVLNSKQLYRDSNYIFIQRYYNIIFSRTFFR